MTLPDVVAHCAALAPEWEYLPIRGNLGDVVIAASTFMAFDNPGISLKRHDDSPDREDRPVMIAGCGNLVPYYRDVERMEHGSLLRRDVESTPGRVTGENVDLSALACTR